MSAYPQFFYHCLVLSVSPAEPPCSHVDKAQDRLCAGCARQSDVRGDGADRSAERSASLAEVQQSWANRWEQPTE